MAKASVWNVGWVAGNPKMCTKVYIDPDGPWNRSRAVIIGQEISERSPAWRVWVEHEKTGKRIFESDAEKDWKATQAAE